MTDIAHQFQVVQEQVHERADLIKHRPGDKTTGIHDGMQSLCAAGRQKLQKEAGLGKWFATGEGHAAAGLIIENSIVFDFSNDLLNSHLPPDHLQRFGITDRCALTADLAALPVNPDCVTLARDRFVRANAQAIITQDATGWAEDQLRLVATALGVVAPAAFQWTALEEYRSADAGTVVDGIFTDIENNPAGHVFTYKRRTIPKIESSIYFRKKLDTKNQTFAGRSAMRRI